LGLKLQKTVSDVFFGLLAQISAVVGGRLRHHGHQHVQSAAQVLNPKRKKIFLFCFLISISRQLPVTASKIDWDKIGTGAHKLAAGAKKE
jgi:hypothetical protein